MGVFERVEEEGSEARVREGKGKEGEEQVKAVGKFVHVCVERGSGKTVREGMGMEVRSGLGALVVGGEGGGGKVKL